MGSKIRSAAWNYFDRIDESNAICLLCRTKIKFRKNSTSNLITHLRCLHKNYNKSYNNNNNNKSKQYQISNTTTASTTTTTAANNNNNTNFYRIEERKEMDSSPCIVISDDFEGYPLESFCISPIYVHDLENVLIPGGLLRDRTERLACDIANAMANEPFTALCVLKGGYQFFGELLDKIRQLHRYRYGNGRIRDIPNAQQIRIEFIRVKSYEDDTSTSNVTITGIESLESLRGKNVLVVEDIIDTGKTMVKLLGLLNDYNPKSIKVTSLFLKRKPGSTGFRPDFIGFEVPDKFIVGCNLDYNEYFRDLSHVCVINEIAKRKYSTKRL